MNEYLAAWAKGDFARNANAEEYDIGDLRDYGAKLHAKVDEMRGGADNGLALQEAKHWALRALAAIDTIYARHVGERGPSCEELQEFASNDGIEVDAGLRAP